MRTAKYISFAVSKVFGNNERIDLFSDTKLGSERFVEKFLAIHDSGEVAPDQVLILQIIKLIWIKLSGIVKFR